MATINGMLYLNQTLSHFEEHMLLSNVSKVHDVDVVWIAPRATGVRRQEQIEVAYRPTAFSSLTVCRRSRKMDLIQQAAE